MSLNIDIPVSKSVKFELEQRKNKNKTSFTEQLKEVFTNAKNQKLEVLANQIIEKYKLGISQRKAKITVKISNVFDEVYFRKVHLALTTKIPKFEFREMLFIIIELALDNE